MKFLIFLLAVFLIAPLSRGFFNAFINLLNKSDLLITFGGGIIIGALLFVVILRRFRALQVFEHEATHAFFALLFLNKITAFRVTSRRGGYISYSGGLGGKFAEIIITLSPYFFPLYTFFALLINLFMGNNYSQLFEFIVGLTFGYHLGSTAEDISINFRTQDFFHPLLKLNTKSDISKSGVIFSFVFITASTLVVNGILLAVITGKSEGLKTFTEITYKSLIEDILFLYSWLIQLMR